MRASDPNTPLMLGGTKGALGGRAGGSFTQDSPKLLAVGEGKKKGHASPEERAPFLREPSG